MNDGNESKIRKYYGISVQVLRSVPAMGPDLKPKSEILSPISCVLKNCYFCKIY